MAKKNTEQTTGLKVSQMDGIIKTQYPMPLARRYRSIHNNPDPMRQLKEWLNFCAEVIKYVSVTAVVIADRHNVQPTQLAQQMMADDNPSFGRLVDLHYQMSKTLEDSDVTYLTNSYNHIWLRETVLGVATREMNALLQKRSERDPESEPRRYSQNHFLRTLVTFKNMFFSDDAQAAGDGDAGDGNTGSQAESEDSTTSTWLTAEEAAHILPHIQNGFYDWLSHQNGLHAHTLVAITKVTSEAGSYVYSGYNLNSGRNPSPYQETHNRTIEPDTVYLQQGDTFISLAKYFRFRDDRKKPRLSYSMQARKDEPVAPKAVKVVQEKPAPTSEPSSVQDIPSDVEDATEMTETSGADYSIWIWVVAALVVGGALFAVAAYFLG
ncbi:MAG: hypothetical protein AAF639_36900 [Chloroflexota bacterium]